MGGKIKPEEELKKKCAGIRREIKRWKYINEFGCNDPFWPDGCNLNLTRNHIICSKNRIESLCSQYGFPLPEEYYTPTPPEVPDNYMANLSQKERVERMTAQGEKNGNEEECV